MMSDQEKKSGGSGASTVLVVEKSASSRHKPYRPTELQDEGANELHKRPRAPAVPFAEELKDPTPNETSGTERTDCERAMSSEKQKHVGKKSSSKRRSSSPEDIAMALMDTKKDNVVTQPQPIPAHVDTDQSSLKPATTKEDDNKLDEDSITEEISDMRTTDAVVAEHSEWSDDEEAGGLPRSESRASRVSRAVRQLFCCGVAYRAPSEEDLPPRECTGI